VTKIGHEVLKVIEMQREMRQFKQRCCLKDFGDFSEKMDPGIITDSDASIEPAVIPVSVCLIPWNDGTRHPHQKCEVYSDMRLESFHMFPLNNPQIRCPINFTHIVLCSMLMFSDINRYQH
jgi:hypothetical protein